MRLTFAVKLYEALDEPVQIAVVSEPMTVVPVDASTLKPIGDIEKFRAGNPVVIIGRRKLQDVRALAAGDKQAISEHVWFAPIGGGRIFLFGLPDGREFESFFGQLRPGSGIWSLPKDVQQAIFTFKSSPPPLARRRTWLPDSE
jgi:hypothetical protein